MAAPGMQSVCAAQAEENGQRHDDTQQDRRTGHRQHQHGKTMRQHQPDGHQA